MANDGRFEVNTYQGAGNAFLAVPLLIALCIGAYVLQLLSRNGLDPQELDRVTQALQMDWQLVRRGELWRLLSYAFAHDPHDFMHIFWNMYGLWFFGRAVEGAIGTARFLKLFVFGAAAGALLHALFSLGGGVPVIGASGAVLGIAAGCALLYPRERLLVFFVIDLSMPTFVICYALISALMAVSGAGMGVAHLAHLGGIAGGYLYVRWIQARYARQFLRSVAALPERPQAPAARPAAVAFHRCQVCGKTEHDPGRIEFRVAADGCEYCREHLPGPAAGSQPVGDQSVT